MLEGVVTYQSCPMKGKRLEVSQNTVPCKLNNVKMTFITLDKYKVLIDN